MIFSYFTFFFHKINKNHFICRPIFNNISEDGGKTIKNPGLITYTDKKVSATADNFVLQKSKLNNNNQAEIRVAIKVQDTGGNETAGNAFRAAIVNKLLEDLIKSVQDTYNGFGYKGLGGYGYGD